VPGVLRSAGHLAFYITGSGPVDIQLRCKSITVVTAQLGSNFTAETPRRAKTARTQSFLRFREPSGFSATQKDFSAGSATLR
jgi:hypothetical protein